VLDALDGAALRTWCERGRDALAARRSDIDAINVYPVPDGDTGTNMALTMQAAAQALPDSHSAATVARAAADSALLGARGSSGAILAEFLAGAATAVTGRETVDGASWSAALSAAARAAYAAVSAPVEGTILTVASAASHAAAGRGGDLADVVIAAAEAAQVALAGTTKQLPALAVAHVVDAGGLGLSVLMDVMVEVVTGTARALQPPRDDAPRVARSSVVAAARESGSLDFGYEVQYLLEAPADRLTPLRARLNEIGDSVVIVSGAGTHNVHVHVNDIGAAIEAGIDIGRPHRITVTRFADQVAVASAADVQSGVVAVTPPGGLSDLFRAAGAVAVPGGLGRRCTPTDLAAAMRECQADHVVVLPNDRDLRGVAEAAADLVRSDGVLAAVLPTRSLVQGLAALAVHDPGRRFGDDVVAMSAAAAATRYAALTRAAQDAQTSAGPCRAGDVLGLIDDDVAVIGDDVAGVARGLLDRLLIGGGELVTLVIGGDAPSGLTEHLTEYLAATRPAVDVTSYDGGQPLHPLLIGVE
jgi:DAK2 domain fusion protein YloV